MAVLQHLSPHESIPVISGFMNLVSVRNRGMAFGLMNNPNASWSFYLLLLIGLGAVALLVFWTSRLNEDEGRLIPGLALILGGALGNVIDRLAYGEVIDFLDFYVGTYHWPAFNVADSAITVGTFWVMAILLFQRSRQKA